MSTNNALCFISVGLMMYGLPTLAPEYFPPHAIYGANTSALWLAFMGIVLGLIGSASLLANEVWFLVRPALAWPPPPVEAELPSGVVIRPAILIPGTEEDRATDKAAA
jgi:hypothetical protein